jgi:DNA-binding HxlR family transcriptional regulator
MQSVESGRHTSCGRVRLRPRRFGELKRLLPGVSEKVLTQQLREMELDDLLHRTVIPGSVPKVEYSVTDFGRTLNHAVTVMSEWGKQHERWLNAKRQREHIRSEILR